MWRLRVRASVWLILVVLLCAADPAREEAPVPGTEPAPAPAGEPLPESQRSREVTPEYLVELDRRLAEMRQKIDRLKQEQQRQEKAAPLMERVFEKVSVEDYTGALGALDEWEQADPEDTRVGSLRALVRQMALEKDPKRKAELLREYLGVAASGS